MSLDPTIAATMTDTVYIAHQSGVSASGQPTWGTPTAYPARVEQVQRQEHSPMGQTIVTRNWILLGPDSAIVRGDRLWLPGSDQSDATQARRVDEINQLPGIPPSTTADHYEVVV